jgi:subtilisin family serine protease
MRRLVAALMAGCTAFGLSAAARAQTTTLAPPDNRYFTGEGSWGQKYPDQWALQRIGFDASLKSAWRLVKRDAKPVVVAVIDTGLDWNHKNIAWDNIWRNPKEIAGNGIDDDKNGFVDDVIGWDFFERSNKPWDHDGHGTFVAGIIAGRWDDKDGIAGINPFVRLMILKGINNFGHTRGSYLAEAITYAADNGARVINLSVGGKDISDVAQAAIDYAYSKGVVIVVAAGNEAVDIRTYGVAASDKVITVASTPDRRDRPSSPPSPARSSRRERWPRSREVRRSTSARESRRGFSAAIRPDRGRSRCRPAACERWSPRRRPA